MSKKHGCMKNNLVVVSVLSVLLLAATLSADIPPIWGNLEPGPNAVGFKTVEKYDYSRTYGYKYDYFGNPIEGEMSRKIQMCIWYPAEESVDRLGMVHGEYAFPYPNENEFVDLLSALQGREIGILHFFLNGNNAVVQDMMNLKFAAVRDATAKEGSFPLIVYHPDIRGAYCQNAVMCEYLASHGFVIATSHYVGTSALNPGMELDDLETGVRDREFVTAYMRDFPYVDCDRLGVLGFAFGGLTALIHQMRNTDINAVASLQGTFVSGDRVEFVSQSPFFDATRTQVPLLQVYAGGQESLDLSLMDSLVCSDRYSLGFSGVQPTDFTQYGVISTLPPESPAPSPETTRMCYETTCRYIRNFFDAYLKLDDAGLAFLNNTPTDNGIDPSLLSATFAASEEIPPTAEQFADIVRSHGIDRAVETCEKFNLDSPDQPVLSGPAFTNLGYQFLQRGEVSEAIVMFRMGVNAYPNSANAWDSYGEACMADGNNELALQNYRKALEVLPNDSTINPQLRDAITNNIPATIVRLEQLIEEQSEGQQ